MLFRSCALTVYNYFGIVVYFAEVGWTCVSFAGDDRLGLDRCPIPQVVGFYFLTIRRVGRHSVLDPMDTVTLSTLVAHPARIPHLTHHVSRSGGEARRCCINWYRVS